MCDAEYLPFYWKCGRVRALVDSTEKPVHVGRGRPPGPPDSDDPADSESRAFTDSEPEPAQYRKM